MRKLFKRLGLLAVVVFVGMQFFQSDRTNPPVDPALNYTSRVTVTPEAAAVIDRACRDCHTHESRWPWYSRVAPTNWFVVGHVDHARSHLNLSELGAYPPKKAAHKLEEMCEEVREGKMPLPSYLWIHRDSILSAQDKERLCAWTQATAAALKGAGGTAGDDEAEETSE